MKHLAIFKGDGAEKILKGEKSIESRFSKGKIAPFGVISSGDLVYIKVSGGDIIGKFKVQKVLTYDGLSDLDIKEIENKFGEQIAAEKNYWKDKRECKYATLIFIGASQRFITSPIKIPKKDLRGWVVLG